MRIVVVVAAVVALSGNSAAAQDRGWLAIGTDSASHAFSFRSADDAIDACGFLDCELVETFTACLAVAYSSETTSNRAVWTWTQAATEGDANRGAQDECEDAGGLACAVMNTYCLDGGSTALRQATPAATAEQENLFWQSIMNSTNPAEYEAYLAQFPNGVFRALAEARLAALVAPVDTRPNASEVVDFGDDAGEFARDGECDDPRFEGPGVWAFDSHRGHDATDCRELFESGRISLRNADDADASGTPAIDFGDDTGDWAQDGECDDPRFTGPGASMGSPSHLRRDATDCREQHAAGRVDFTESDLAGGGRADAPGRGESQDPDCSRERLIALSVLTSQLPGAVPSTIQFTDSRMIIISRPAPGAALRQESEYEVSADAITYRIVRAIGTIPGSGTSDQPIRNPGPHTEACSLSGGVLSFGDGTWR